MMVFLFIDGNWYIQGIRSVQGRIERAIYNLFKPFQSGYESTKRPPERNERIVSTFCICNICHR